MSKLIPPDSAQSSGALPDLPGGADVGALQVTPTPLTRRERAAVLGRIHALMEYWGITVDDLAREDPVPPSATPADEPDRPAHPIKYRHPVTGDTWDGQGPHPDWLRKALLQEGLRVDELRP